ncbi:hypothetical protein SLEP1_g12357 [Rubroshorea leprosula]|uniref:Uncharacterized protein n=1 Tax=Rubroshorea leprosula TaxID=152421 RepID=A0AAV5IMD8_9ROSI|nr:hypothetical protein SLEP1_g12357 [Rubroshorea leprosula]
MKGLHSDTSSPIDSVSPKLSSFRHCLKLVSPKLVLLVYLGTHEGTCKIPQGTD